MIRKETQIEETVTGTWLRFPNNFRKFHCLVELPNQLALNIDLRSGTLHVHKKDSNDVFQFIGDLAISAAGSQIRCAVNQLPVMDTRAEELPLRQSDAS